MIGNTPIRADGFQSVRFFLMPLEWLNRGDIHLELQPEPHAFTFQVVH